MTRTEHTPDVVADGDTGASRRTLVMDWIGLACRLIFGGVMLWAGVTKAMEIEVTQRATQAFEILPYDLANVWGMLMPFVEIVVGVFLLTGFMTRFAAVFGTLLMVAFIIGIISVWVRGISIDCGCFGGGGAVTDPSYGMDLARDVALLALVGWLLVRPRTALSLDRKLFA